MTIPTKKLKNGFEMPVFGIGTYNILGENNTDNFSEQKRQDEINSIKKALELGVSHIDTAESYANGQVEEVVGEAIADFKREKLFLVSKIKKQNLDRGEKGIREAINGSLARLKTSYLDLYLMHRCPKEALFKECVRTMNELVDEGLVKYIGLSNTNTKHTEMLCLLTKHPFVVNQVHLNLQFREPENDGLVEYCQQNDIMVEAWRPVNKGSLSKSGTDITKPGVDILDQMCAKYNKTPAQISINWLISQKNITAIAKSSNQSHLIDNLGALGWQMRPEDIERLSKEFPNQQFISDTVALA